MFLIKFLDVSRHFVSVLDIDVYFSKNEPESNIVLFIKYAPNPSVIKSKLGSVLYV